MITNLPIIPYLKEISNMVIAHNITIISTPTGSGKTLLVPSWLQETLRKYVAVTVPRILLARSARNGMVNLVYGRENAVGLKTGKGDCYPNANIQVCTEGSFSARHFYEMLDGEILFVDEIHEQGINTEEVLFLALQHIRGGGKIVLSSATMEVGKYKNYFESFGFTVGVFEMAEPKRPFETEIVFSDDWKKTVIELGGRTLIGVGGKGDIDWLDGEFKRMGYKGRIFPLHAELEEWEEAEALEYRGDCLYIATSVGMSGITFPMLDNVKVPSLGKRVEDGKLVEYNLSIAEQKQWEGRVGRTKNGIAVYANEEILPNREKNPIPEILLADIRGVVLSFAIKGYDLEEIRLLNHPPIEKIREARKFLIENGLLDGELERVTEKGEFVYRTGAGVDCGLIIWAGEQLGIRATAEKIAVLIENGSPFRKVIPAFSRQLLRNCKICQISDHYRIIRAIEEDESSHFGDNKIQNEIVREYGKKEGIFLKGVNKMLRKFNKIDNIYVDTVEVNEDFIQRLFAVQPPKNIFENGWNAVIGDIINSSAAAVDIDKRVYCTLTPLQLKRGRIVEMVTKIE